MKDLPALDFCGVFEGVSYFHNTPPASTDPVAGGNESVNLILDVTHWISRKQGTGNQKSQGGLSPSLLSHKVTTADTRLDAPVGSRAALVAKPCLSVCLSVSLSLSDLVF